MKARFTTDTSLAIVTRLPNDGALVENVKHFLAGTVIEFDLMTPNESILDNDPNSVSIIFPNNTFALGVDVDLLEILNDDHEFEYDVEVERTSYAYHTIRVSAKDEVEARIKALDEAGNHEYNEKSARYDVNYARRLESD